ncbi:hypothetical protein GINT2_001234 [Glugoides intestinalis]
MAENSLEIKITQTVSKLQEFSPITFKDEELLGVLREEIESNVENFYFIPIPDLPKYVLNLVSLNKFLVIDDIIFQKLTLLEKKQSRNNVLYWLFLLLKNRSFPRSTLKHIFNCIVYLDLENDNQGCFYKYGILKCILLHYRFGDKCINEDLKFQVCRENNTKTFPDKLVVNFGEGIVLISEFIENKETGTDNVSVLANVVWENTKILLETFPEVNESLLQPPEGESFNWKQVETEYFESFCIIGLYSVAIQSTGAFFQNRIAQNIDLFYKFRKLHNFEAFCRVMLDSFKCSKELIESIKSLSAPKGNDK